MVREYQRLDLTPDDKAVIAQENGGAARWTSAEIDLLRECRASGMSWLQTALWLGRSKASVCGKGKRLGMTE